MKINGLLRSPRHHAGLGPKDKGNAPVAEILEKRQETPAGPSASLAVRDLEAALDDEQFVLHYQPKIDLKSGEAAGVEALVRWAHPDLGLLEPGLFIPLAEDSGLIDPLTSSIVQKSAQQMTVWKAQGIDLPVSINMTGLQMIDLELPDRLAAQLAAAEIDPAMLTLEVTEQSVLVDAPNVAVALKRFSRTGLQLSLDDFGGGFASFLKLYRMPFNELKIDSCWLLDLCQREDRRIMVRSIINLAHDIGLATCAEKVESLDTLKLLRTLGCDSAQGYCIARPLPGERIAEAIEGW